MAEFVAFSPDAEIRGRAILGMARALGERAPELLARHGLVDVQPDEFYPQQAWLNALKEVSVGDANAMFNFIAIAKEIARNIPLPEGIDSIEAVLQREGDVYKMNNRGCSGYISAEAIGPKHMHVTVCNPYPHDMMYGIVWGLATRFEPRVVVRYLNNEKCATEADCCTYEVLW